MQTKFSPAQLEDPAIRTADGILRACVHCGFCTATCPTFVLLGDERDSPRGRIYLIKEMLEKDRPATAADTLPRRPLPVVSRVHDDVPVRCELHAPRRPCPHAHREDVSPSADGPSAAAHSCGGACPTRAGSAWRCAWPPWTRPFAGSDRPQRRPPDGARPADNASDDENRPMKPSMPAAVNSARTVAPRADALSRIGAMLSLAPRTLPAAAPAHRGSTRPPARAAAAWPC